MRAGLAAAASRQVSAGSLAIFRIAYGIVGIALALRFFTKGWIESLLLDPAFHFTYPGFHWVVPLPGPWMYAVFAVLAATATSIALGLRTRLSALLFGLCLAYVELLDRSLYLNHYYWMVLTAVLLVVMPTDRLYSLGARRGGTEEGFVPMWAVWVFRFQVGMVYFFAGVAKLNPDWLARAEPLATWLPARSGLWLVGPLLAAPATAFVLSWAGAFFDLTIVMWLSLRGTRAVAFASLAGFHLVTWVLFPSIGVFPLLMTLGATVFFSPSWPGRFLGSAPAPAPVKGRIRPAPAALLCGYCLVMVFLPLRHHLIGADVRWSGDGYLGSWMVMLGEKSGSATFLVTDPESGASWRVPAPQYLTRRQQVAMATDPAMILQVAEAISVENGGASVSADVLLAYNGRTHVQFTNPALAIAGPGAVPLAQAIMPPPD